MPILPLTLALALSHGGRGDLGVLPARFMGDDSWPMRIMESLPQGNGATISGDC